LQRPAVLRLAEEGVLEHQAIGLEGDTGELRRALAGCEALIHLAYSPPLRKGFWAELGEQVEANLLPTIGLLDAADAAQVPFFCLASSVSVYSPPAVRVAEDSKVGVGVSPYALNKLEQEQLARTWAQDPGRSAAVLRLASVYGPGETAHRAIPGFIRAALAGQPLIVDGHGDQLFDPIYVDDAVEAISAAVGLRADGVFNIATGQGRTALDVANLVVQLTGASVEVVEDHNVASRGGAVCNVFKAAAELGFRAGTGFEAGLAQEIDWVRQEQLGEGGAHSPGQPTVVVM
jgi:UDP-glucose 4-epimerase